MYIHSLSITVNMHTGLNVENAASEMNYNF